MCGLSVVLLVYVFQTLNVFFPAGICLCLYAKSNGVSALLGVLLFGPYHSMSRGFGL